MIQINEKSKILIRKLTVVICLLGMSQMGFSTNYEFINSGFASASYTNPNNWVGGIVGPTIIGVSDTVILSSTFTTCVIDIHIENFGLITIQGSAKVIITDTVSNYATLINQGDFQNYHTLISFGTFDNNWSFKNGMSDVFENWGMFTSNGCENSGTIINRGVFHVEGTFEDDTLRPNSTFENSGQLMVGSFARYYMGLGFKNLTSGIMNNDGEIKTYYNFPASVYNDGQIYNNLGSIDIHPLFITSGPHAKIRGHGLINAYSASIDGALCPDDPMKIITEFPCLLTDSTLIEIEINLGPAFDTLHFSNVGLSGILKVRYSTNQRPYECRDYVIITFDQLFNAQGFTTFDSLDLPTTNPGFKWEVVYNPNDVTLRYYPDDDNNNALNFQSIGNVDSGYIHVNSSIGMAKTIEFRFFPEKTNPNEPGEMIMSLDNSAGSYILSMGLTSAVEGETMSLTNGAGMIYTTYPFDKEWYHVAFVADINHYTKIYVNGMPVPVFFRDPNLEPQVYEIDSFRIGARKPYPQGFTQAFFRGKIDELRFWDHARSESQILDYFYRELLNQQAFGLRAYYPMNQGKRNDSNQCIDYLEDVSAFGNHGQLYDFSLVGSSTNWIGSLTCEALIPSENVFIGEAVDSTSWFEDENWSLGIPTGCHHAIIPDAMQVIVDADQANCFTIEVENGGRLEVLESKSLDVKLSVF